MIQAETSPRFEDGLASVLSGLAGGGAFAEPAHASRFNDGWMIAQLKLQTRDGTSAAYHRKIAKNSKPNAADKAQRIKDLNDQMNIIETVPEDDSPGEVAVSAGLLTGAWIHILNDPFLREALMFGLLEKTLSTLEALEQRTSEVRAQYLANAAPLWNYFDTTLYRVLRNEGFLEETIAMSTAVGSMVPGHVIDQARRTQVKALQKPLLEKRGAVPRHAPFDWRQFQPLCDSARDRVVVILENVLTQDDLLKLITSVSLSPVIGESSTVENSDAGPNPRISLNQTALAAGGLNGFWARYDSLAPDDAVHEALVKKTGDTLNALDHHIYGRRPVALYLALTKDLRARLEQSGITLPKEATAKLFSFPDATRRDPANPPAPLRQAIIG